MGESDARTADRFTLQRCRKKAAQLWTRRIETAGVAERSQTITISPVTSYDFSRFPHVTCR